MESAPYERLPPDRPADELERELLALWEVERLFEQTLAKNADAPPFVFFEGPPTANGRPGIHHVFSRTVKDLFCRYRAMKGYRVERKAGWDTHGLPVEIEVEKQLGISGKQEIEAIGVAEFNRLCRESVFRYRGDWERLSARMGYWLDYANPYVTYSNNYVESVWWALQTLYDRGLLYRGHKILPYCPRCGTALSSHEVAQGYEEVEDPSVYVALELVAERDVNLKPPFSRRILVWTTTPWTLVSNAALAVNPDLEYAELVRRTGEDYRTIILAADRLGAVLGEDYDNRWEIVRRFRGGELVGRRYRRPFDWVPYPDGVEHEVIVGESFVSAEDGSGVVHMAPAFGADDYAAGQRHNLAFLQPVDTRGQFPRELPVVGGLFVKDADALLIEELKRRGVLWKSLRITHSYPHCWRCDTPLLVVRAHDRLSRLDAGAQCRRRLASAGSGRGPFRRVAQEQHRLGDLARSLLGYTAAAVALRRRRESRRGNRQLRRAREARGPAAFGYVRSAQAADRWVPLALFQRQLHRSYEARTRGDRHLVRFRIDVLRPVALSVREP